MAAKKILILWSDSTEITIDLEQNPAAEYLHGCLKHLRHLDLHFNARSNPYELDKVDRIELCGKFTDLGQALGVPIDKDRLSDQNYLNCLHEIYFQSVNGTVFEPTWLEFHDCIHILETLNGQRIEGSSVWFDYSTLAGLLEKNFDQSWMQYAVPEVNEGVCYLKENELGKSLDFYYKDQEPPDLSILCKLAKPWVRLRPTMFVSIGPSLRYQEFQHLYLKDFEAWFSPLKRRWCDHWGLPDWEPWHIFARIPIGHMSDIAVFKEKFKMLDYPLRLIPC